VALLKALLKATGGPGSIPFLLLGLGLGFALHRLGERGRRLGRVWIVILSVLYLVLGMPIVANQIADSLTTYHPMDDLSRFGRVDTVVVLDGDNRRGRVREARRLYDTVHPGRVVVSGDAWMVEALVKAGIPSSAIVHDEVPQTTWEQLERLRAMDGPQTVVVASRLQMPRLAEFAEAMGLTVRLAPAPLDAEPANSGAWVWVPSYLALRKSRDALYEHAARAYYARIDYQPNQ
jgi:Uncharacterized conserved protein